MLVNEDNDIAVDYLMPLPRLDESMAKLDYLFGIKKEVKIEKKKVTHKVVDVNDISSSLKDRLIEFYKVDIDLYQKAVKGEFGLLEEVVKFKWEASYYQG